MSIHPGLAVVSKFVGDAADSSAKIEASLDIQFIMGVAPGVKTEFWLFNSGALFSQTATQRPSSTSPP